MWSFLIVLKDYIKRVNSTLNLKRESIALFYWFACLTIMTFIMILIGGLTRLTDSGLSMVDWKPLMGAIPPLTDQDWLNLFDNYKQSPEFLIVNKSMELGGFKYIFWWEWFHRFFARLIGLMFVIPMIIFIIQKKISRKLFYYLIILFLFGLFQGLVGWWMVKSGLNDNPYVSSYRLAFHLSNAVIILSILFWLTLNSHSNTSISFVPNKKIEFKIFYMIILLFITIVSGAFMAGSNAGQSFNSYPLMNGVIFPEDYYMEGLGIKNFFENTIAINFNHRWISTITFLLIISFIFYLFISKNYIRYNFNLYLIFIFLCLQFLLGILTLLSNVEISFASMHQVNSMLLLASIIFFYHSIKMKG